MSRGVLITGGMGPSPGYLNIIVHDGDLVCAADSGLEAALAAGIAVDGVVGDMDSLSDRSLLDTFPENAVQRHPGDKDFTDTELGMAWLRSRGCTEIVLTGGGEGRLDHTLALLALYKREQAPELWYTSREEIRLLEKSEKEQNFAGQPGEPVSFFPAGRGPWKIESRGLHWELAHVAWNDGLVSLSNRMVSGRVVLKVLSGCFMMIRPLEAALADKYLTRAF